MAAEKKRQNESPVEELSSAPRLKKAKKKLDLELGDMPTFIFDAEAEKKKEEEEVAKHGGRIRTLPVAAGHWPTHIYLSVNCDLGFQGQPTVEKMEQVTALKSLAKQMSTQSSPWTFFDPTDLHISLARTFSLRHTELDKFPQQLGEAIANANLSRLGVLFDGWRLLVNDNKTTSFASLVATTETEQALACINVVDGIMQRFGHPTYYEERIVHASLAWTPSDISTQHSSSEPLQGVISPPIRCTAQVEKIYCKIGKVLYAWPLQ